jgi:hypothetical protein
MKAESSRSLTKYECQAPHEAQLLANGDVAIVCEGDHVKPSHVMVIDPETLATKATWPVGVYPDKIVFVGSP